MSLIFNSVTWFYEQIGRRTVQAKKNTLDQITCIFTGPTEDALGFLPANGTPHPQFPLMLCSNAEILTLAALMAEVRVSYIGKLVGSPNGIYRTVPNVNRSRHIGSVSFTNSFNIFGGNAHATLSYTVRYTAKGVTLKYLTNEILAGDFAGYFVEQATPYLGTENVTSFQSAPPAYAAGPIESNEGFLYGGAVTNQLVWQNDLVDVGIEDLDNGWYNVSENYMTTPYINSTLPGAIGPIFITIGP